MPEAVNLEALAVRCEAAEAADRNLDAMIHFAITNGVGCGMAQDAPAYSASIDAALQLVPEGWARGFTDRRTVPGMKVNAQCWTSADRSTVHGDAATPALALCAAALRARANTIGEEPCPK